MTDTAARMQPQQTQRRDVPTWVLIFITAIIAIGTSYATLQVTTATTASKTEEHTQQIRELQQNTVTRREMDQLRSDIKDMRLEMNQKFDKLLERK